MRTGEAGGDNTRLLLPLHNRNRRCSDAPSDTSRTKMKLDKKFHKFPDLRKSRPTTEARSRRPPGRFQLSLPACKARPKLASEVSHPDFRQLYYKREVTWQSPRDPTLLEGVRSFCKYTRLQRTKTMIKNPIPTSEEIKKEKEIISYHESIRGYSRRGDIDDAEMPSFPSYSVWERMSPTVDDDDDVGERNKSAMSRLSDFSDFGLPRIFAEIHFWQPSENAKLLPSRRKNNLLYSRMYPWHPKPVTYHNFFLPQIEKT